MKAVPISSSNKTGSSITASTGTDSEEIEKFAVYPLNGNKTEDKQFESPTDVVTTQKILDKAKSMSLTSSDSEDMPPLTMPIYEPDHKAEKIKSIFKKMKHKACIKKENKLLIDILKKAENKKA